jgi:hypothetical protein
MEPSCGSSVAILTDRLTDTEMSLEEKTDGRKRETVTRFAATADQLGLGEARGETQPREGAKVGGRFASSPRRIDEHKHYY